MENQDLKLEHSASIVEISKALCEFQNSVKSVGKDGTNPFYHSTYATFGNIVDTVREPLHKNGLSYSQWPIGKNKLATILLHTSGEWIKGTVEMTPKDTSPQASGSAITYMRRYSLSAVLGIATEDDDDGNEASSPTPVKSVVKKGKVGSEDVYADATLAIEQAKTTAQLFKLQERIEKSDKLTDNQKDTLDKMISSRVDQLDNPPQP